MYLQPLCMTLPPNFSPRRRNNGTKPIVNGSYRKIMNTPECQTEPSIKICVMGRWILIILDQNKEIGIDLKKFLHDDFLIIHDDHAGRREVCHVVPLKNKFD